MTVWNKVIAVLLATLGVCVLLLWAIERLVVYPSFVELERTAAIRDIKRCTNAIQRELEHLETFVNDWSAWNETYAYAKDKNVEYREANLVTETFIDAKINFICLADTSGQVIWCGSTDLTTGEELDSPFLSDDLSTVIASFVPSASTSERIVGLQRTKYGLMLFASLPILTNESKGPPRGSFIMGRLLTSDLIAALAEQTQVSFTTYFADSDTRRKTFNELVSAEPRITEVSDTDLTALSALPGISDDSDLLIHATIGREIISVGKGAMRITRLLVCLSGLFTAALLLFGLKLFVVQPILQLTEKATSIGVPRKTSHDFESLPRVDEMRELEEAFDSMVDRLAQSKTQLIGTIAGSMKSIVKDETFKVFTDGICEAVGVEQALLAELADGFSDEFRVLASSRSKHGATEATQPLGTFSLYLTGDTVTSDDLNEQQLDSLSGILKGQYTLIVRLCDSEADTVGCLCVANSQTLDRAAISTLQIFAAHANAELLKRKSRVEKEASDVLLDEVVQGSADGVYLQDLTGQILIANPAWSNMTGVSVNDMLGNTDRDLFGPELGESFDRHRAALFSLSDPQVFEFETTQRKAIQVSMSLHRNSRREAVGMIGVCRDITALRAAEESSRKHLGQLAHASRLSTMGEMATGIAHELNQPLTVIVNTAFVAKQMLEDDAAPQEILPVLEQATQQSMRAAAILKRLRSLVQGSTTRHCLISINQVIRDAIDVLKHELFVSDINLSTNLQESPPNVLGDEIQLQQVVINLLRNACDELTTCHQGHREVSIVSKIHRDQVCVAISDNGRGIAAQDIATVFDAFYSSKSNGMGMGLAISRSIVEILGGRIWVEANSDNGATFNVTLPIATRLVGEPIDG